MHLPNNKCLKTHLALGLQRERGAAQHLELSPCLQKETF